MDAPLPPAAPASPPEEATPAARPVAEAPAPPPPVTGRPAREKALPRTRRRRSRALRRTWRRRWPYPETYVPGNEVMVYDDGASCYAAMLEAISAAQQSVHLETYILRSDETGWRFGRALAERADAGVEVAVMYDAVGSLTLSSEFLEFLAGHGVRVVAYHPILPWKKRFGLTKRDHRKILVVDGAVGFVGGMNVADEHLPVEDGGRGWRDTHVRLVGPAAISLDRLFIAEWVGQGGPDLREPFGAPAHTHGVPVRVVENRHLVGRSLVRGAYLDALRYAARRIWIANSYFVPDRRFVRALERAAARGVDVRILVAGRSDLQFVTWAGEFLYDRLLAAGVRIFEWRRSVLHAKTAVVDGRWVTVGTYNFDRRSLTSNLEVNAMILDEQVAARVERTFEQDMEASQALDLAGWRRRSLFARVRSWFLWLFRAWL